MRRQASARRRWSRGCCCPAILASPAQRLRRHHDDRALPHRRRPLAAAADAARRSTRARGPTSAIPRSIAHGTRVFTGCVSTTRGIVVHQYDLRTGETFHAHLHRNKELDDHDNPSLAFWRHRIYAFYSPHSGQRFPLDVTARCTTGPRGAVDLHAGFGPERHVPTNTPGPLGYTYPNPDPDAGQPVAVLARGQLVPTLLLHRATRTGSGATPYTAPKHQRPIR